MSSAHGGADCPRGGESAPSSKTHVEAVLLPRLPHGNACLEQIFNSPLLIPILIIVLIIVDIDVLILSSWITRLQLMTDCCRSQETHREDQGVQPQDRGVQREGHLRGVLGPEGVHLRQTAGEDRRN